MRKSKRNYERYATMTENKYNKKGLSHYIMRRPGDMHIFPYIDVIKNKDILEVGAGYGYYTSKIKCHNNVEIVDINLELCEKIEVPAYCCSADKLTQHIDNHYDYVMSFWMTEYLNKEQLYNFIEQGMSLLRPGGKLYTTIIRKRGMGWLYTFGARLKGVMKYSYSLKEINELVKEFGLAKVTKVNTFFGIAFCVVVEIQMED